MLAIFLVSSLLLLAESRINRYDEGSCPAIENEPWSYSGESNGPSEWGVSYSNCYGKAQSPVSIQSSRAKRDSNLKSLSLEGYDTKLTKAKIVNNGHTVEITPQDDETRAFSLDGDTYTLSQLHFHWGDRWDRGAEHLVNGMAYAMEGHFVHKNAENKTAVIGVLYQTSFLSNSALSPIVKDLQRLKYKGDETDLSSNLNLRKLLPSDLSHYYRYQGSLTTPPCDEGVTWTLMQINQPVGMMQMEEFRKLYAVPEEEASDSSCHLVNNYRPVQPLNDRIIYVSTYY